MALQNAAPTSVSTNAVCQSHMRRPLFFVACYWLMRSSSFDLIQSFLRTRVSCVTPKPVNGKCPEGSFFQREECVPTLPGNPGWSGSAHCADRTYATVSSVATSGRIIFSLAGLNIVAYMVIGMSLCDRVGRKLVLILAMFGLTFFCTTCAAAAFLNNYGVGLTVISVGVAVANLTDSFSIGVYAMISDLTKDDDIGRGSAFSYMQVSRMMGVLVGGAVGFFILKAELEDYTIVWLCMCSICVGFSLSAVVCLRETISSNARDIVANSSGSHDTPAGSDVASSPNSHCRVACGPAFADSRETLRMLRHDAFLRYTVVLGFFVHMSFFGVLNIYAGYAITIVGLSQAVQSLAGVLQPMAIMVGSWASAWLIARSGPFCVMWIGYGLMSAGFFMCGLTSLLSGNIVQVLWWVGVLITGFGAGICSPGESVVVSSRASSSFQGKAFTAQALPQMIGSSVGGMVWTNVLFTGRQGWLAGAGFFLSAGIMFLALLCSVALYRLYIASAARSDSDTAPAALQPHTTRSHVLFENTQGADAPKLLGAGNMQCSLLKSTVGQDSTDVTKK